MVNMNSETSDSLSLVIGDVGMKEIIGMLEKSFPQNSVHQSIYNNYQNEGIVRQSLMIGNLLFLEVDLEKWYEFYQIFFSRFQPQIKSICLISPIISERGGKEQDNIQAIFTTDIHNDFQHSNITEVPYSDDSRINVFLEMAESAGIGAFSFEIPFSYLQDASFLKKLINILKDFADRL